MYVSPAICTEYVDYGAGMYVRRQRARDPCQGSNLANRCVGTGVPSIPRYLSMYEVARGSSKIASSSWSDYLIVISRVRPFAAIAYAITFTSCRVDYQLNSCLEHPDGRRRRRRRREREQERRLVV